MSDTQRLSSARPESTPNSMSDFAGWLASNHNIYYEQTAIKLPRGANSTPNKGHYSIFNDYHVISLHGGNYPVTDEDSLTNNDYFNKSNAIDLINNPRGASIFMPRDFLLCKRYGMPINKMITLRRFPMPCGDDIFMIAEDRGPESTMGGATEPDVGRMITYMDQEFNKLSEICKFGYKLNWKQLSAATEEGSSGMSGDNAGVSGMMRSIASVMDDGTLGRNAAQGSNRLNMNPMQDNNKIYGPVDSIAKTTIRDIGLESEMSFNIVFDYELRSINGLNQKHMFMDLLSNILACTYNNGKFWGGARVWTGERPSSWMRKMAFMNPTDAEDFMNRGRVAFKDALKPFSGGNGAQAAVQMLKNIVVNGMNLALGKILDKVGRPSVLVMNSLLNADNTGEWHLTIGNPLNPIMSIGNLILTNTEIEFGDQLGYDDFPTNIKVTCTLSEGRPRDKAGIESVFNMGKGRTYWTPQSILKNKMTISNTTDSNKSVEQINTFGEFNDADILRSADVQADFIRDPESKGSIDLSISVNDVKYTSIKPESIENTITTNSNESVDIDENVNK